MKIYRHDGSSWSETDRFRQDDSSRHLIVLDGGELGTSLGESLIRSFDIHDLELVDLSRPRHIPKFEAFDHNALLIQRELVAGESLSDATYSPLSICWTDKHCLIVSHHSSFVISEISRLILDSQENQFANNPLELAIWVSRKISGIYLKRLLTVEERLEELGDELEGRTDDQFLHEALGISTMLKKTVRTLRYQKMALKQMVDSNTDNSIDIDHHFQDALEAVDRISTLSSVLSDISSELMNAFLSLHAHRLNRIMQILTICTVIFLPLGLIAGVYGMNFSHIPGMSHPHGFLITILGMVFCSVSIIVLLRKLKWT